MAEAYDPIRQPDPVQWRALGEDERIELVLAHHRDAGVELPNEQVHAVVHVVVENQVALGYETSVRATLERLVREGLDWQEALHAIGSVLVEFMQQLFGEDAAPGLSQRYDAQLEKLSAAEWLRRFE